MSESIGLGSRLIGMKTMKTLSFPKADASLDMSELMLPPAPRVPSGRITIPMIPAMSDAIEQTAVPTVVPPARRKDMGRYSYVGGRFSEGGEK